MGCSKEKKDSEIGLDLDQTFSMCCSELFSRVGIPLIQKNRIILIPAEGWIQGGFQEQNVIKLLNWSNNTTFLSVELICLKLGKAIYFRSIFCYICWNSLYIQTAINNSSALTKKGKKSGVCGCHRTVISPSNHFIRTEWNDWTGYLPVQLRIWLPARTLTLHSLRMPVVFHTARRLKLAN